MIYVVVDRLSKHGHFLPLKGDFTSHMMAKNFIHHIAKLHGIPRTIVRDWDKAFTSKFWNHSFTRMGTTLSISTSKTWIKLLPLVEFSYNTSFYTSIGMTPFKVVYGRYPPGFIAYQSDGTDHPSSI